MSNTKSYFSASAEWASKMGFFDDIPWSVMKNINLEDEYMEFSDEGCGGDGTGLRCEFSVSFRFDAYEDEFYFAANYSGSSVFAMNMCDIEWTHYCEDCEEFIDERDESNGGWDDYKCKCGKCVEEEEREEEEACGCCKKE